MAGIKITPTKLFVIIVNSQLCHTKSLILNLLMFFTSSIPVFSSVSLSFSNLLFIESSTESVVFSRAHMTNGKPNFSLYLKTHACGK